jgi:hypothetical protein
MFPNGPRSAHQDHRRRLVLNLHANSLWESPHSARAGFRSHHGLTSGLQRLAPHGEPNKAPARSGVVVGQPQARRWATERRPRPAITEPQPPVHGQRARPARRGSGLLRLLARHVAPHDGPRVLCRAVYRQPKGLALQPARACEVGQNRRGNTGKASDVQSKPPNTLSQQSQDHPSSPPQYKQIVQVPSY